MPRATRPFWRLIALLSLLLLIGAACGDDDDTESGGTPTTEEGATDDGGEAKTIKLAFVGPLTGPNANLGIAPRNGARVAVEEFNEENTEYDVQLEEFDTQGDPAQATTLKDQFIDDEEIVGIIGPTFSGETRALLPDLEDASLVMVSPSATAVDLPETVAGSTVFHRIVPDDDVQGAALTEYVNSELQAKSIAYVHDNAEYGKGLAEGTRALLEKGGATTAVTAVIDPESQDFSAAVNQVKAANPDAVFYGGYYAEAGRLSKQLVDAGVEAQFLSGDGSLDPGFVESAGAAGAEGARVTCACRLATTESEGELGEFANTFEEVNNTQPGTYATEGYDAARILLAGIADGNDTREALVEYVEGLGSYEGLSKTIEFEDNGNVKAGAVFAYEYKGGKIEELGTIEELVG